jgi:hypothetical protein
MNNFKTLETDYLRSSRTIESVLVSNNQIEKLFFVYNFEGYYFRVFDTVLALINFFDKNIESHVSFDQETELDNFFLNVKLIQ